MNLRAVDAETTGLPAEAGDENAIPTGIMQIGWCDVNGDDPIGPPKSELVDCGIPVQIQARAIHHISDAMVAGKMSPTEACRILVDGDFDVMAAHNVDHEKHYIGTGFKPGTEEVRPWLCTYKPALRLWPDAPGHKLQELRYYLDLDAESDFDPALCAIPHLAPDDAYVCAHLARRVLIECEAQGIDFDRLIKWSAGPGLLVMCWMKKHKGKTWSWVAHNDRPYLDWIYNKSDITDRDIRATAKYWLKQTAHAESPHPAGDPYTR